MEISRTRGAEFNWKAALEMDRHEMLALGVLRLAARVGPIRAWGGRKMIPNEEDGPKLDQIGHKEGRQEVRATSRP